MYIRSFDNTKIFYHRSHSKNPKGTILFVHGGFHGNHTLLNDLMLPFRKDYDIIAPDLRGRGDSDFPKSIKEDKLEDYSKDLFEILRYEKIKKINLVGISFGGLVSLQFITDYSKQIKVEKIALISSTHDLKQINRKTKAAKIAYSLFAGIISLLTFPLKPKKKENIDYSTAKGRLFPIKYGIKLIRNNSLKTIVLRYKMMKNILGASVPLEKLKEIDSKFLLIYGEKDFFFKLESQEEIKKTTNGTIKRIKGAGHDLYIKNAEVASKEIKRFFSR